MNFESLDVSFVIFIALGLYIIFRGVMTLATGKLHPREEAMLDGYSENGIKRFKILSAVTNIIGGLLVIGIALVRLLNIADRSVLSLVTLVVVAVMLVVYFLIRNSCKKM